MSVPRATLVLVHGAWHGRWCWERVTPYLERRGIEALTLDLPSVQGWADGSMGGSPAGPAAGPVRESVGGSADSMAGSADAAGAPGLPEDAAAVRSLLDTLAGPVVLCGHSYAGMVISLAAAGRRDVAELVYLTAFMPERGQSLVAASGNRHAPWIRMLDGGLSLPDVSRVGEALYGDCDPATRDWAVARLRPQQAVAFTQPVPQPAWREIPSTYIVCSEDKAMRPERQRTVFAPRARRVLDLDAGHSPFLSRPEALAAMLAGVAERD